MCRIEHLCMNSVLHVTTAYYFSVCSRRQSIFDTFLEMFHFTRTVTTALVHWT